MERVTYNNGTPGVTYTYDRLGRQTQITDTAGTRVFAYHDDPLDELDLPLETKTINGIGGGLYQKTITRDYKDGSGNTLADRLAGFHIGSEYQTAYRYDTYGRIERITGLGLLLCRKSFLATHGEANFFASPHVREGNPARRSVEPENTTQRLSLLSWHADSTPSAGTRIRSRSFF